MEDKQSCHDDLTILCLGHNCGEHRVRLIWERAKVNDYMCNKCQLQDAHGPMQELTRLSYPFYNSQQVKYDLLLIPTKGTFLDNYRSSTGLHIGIASGQGTIIEFSCAGVNTDSQRDVRWQQSIRLNFLEKLFSSEHSEYSSTIELDWGTAIERLLQQDQARWLSQAYHESNNNCFDFILEFIRVFVSLNKNYETSISTEMSECLTDKIKFCHVFVIPETKTAARYLCLYKKLMTCNNDWTDD